MRERMTMQESERVSVCASERMRMQESERVSESERELIGVHCLRSFFESSQVICQVAKSGRDLVRGRDPLIRASLSSESIASRLTI